MSLDTVIYNQYRIDFAFKISPKGLDLKRLCKLIFHVSEVGDPFTSNENNGQIFIFRNEKGN